MRVTRYGFFGITIRPYALGNWVRFEDYAALLSEHKRILSRLHVGPPPAEHGVRVELGWEEIDPGTDPVRRNNDHEDDHA